MNSIDKYWQEYNWPAARARNFVKAMGGKPTKYAENIEFLAKIASIEPKMMCMLNPVKFANQYFPNKYNIREQLIKIMGRGIYYAIAWDPYERYTTCKVAEPAVAEPPPVAELAPVAEPVVDYATLFNALSFEDKKKAYLLLIANK